MVHVVGCSRKENQRDCRGYQSANLAGSDVQRPGSERNMDLTDRNLDRIEDSGPRSTENPDFGFLVRSKPEKFGSGQVDRNFCFLSKKKFIC